MLFDPNLKVGASGRPHALAFRRGYCPSRAVLPGHLSPWPPSLRGKGEGNGGACLGRAVLPGQDGVAVLVLADGLDDQLHLLANGQAVVLGLAAGDHREYHGALRQAYEGLNVGGGEAWWGLARHGEGLQTGALPDARLGHVPREAGRTDGAPGEGNVAAGGAARAEKGRAVARVVREAEETLSDGNSA